MKLDLRAHRCQIVQIRFIWCGGGWRRVPWELTVVPGLGGLRW